jgi:hypothetical protein
LALSAPMMKGNCLLLDIGSHDEVYR